MKRLNSLFHVFLIVFVVITTFSCKQSEGDRCQLDSDCEDGLKCCFSTANPSAEDIIHGGVCTVKEQCYFESADAGVDSFISDAETTNDTQIESDSTVDSLAPDTTNDTLAPDNSVDSQVTQDQGNDQTAASDAAATADSGNNR